MAIIEAEIDSKVMNLTCFLTVKHLKTVLCRSLPAVIVVILRKDVLWLPKHSQSTLTGMWSRMRSINLSRICTNDIELLILDFAASSRSIKYRMAFLHCNSGVPPIYFWILMYLGGTDSDARHLKHSGLMIDTFCCYQFCAQCPCL